MPTQDSWWNWAGNQSAAGVTVDRHADLVEVTARRYPRFAEFTAVRDRLDPAGVFGNAHLDRVLAPVPTGTGGC